MSGTRAVHVAATVAPASSTAAAAAPQRSPIRSREQLEKANLAARREGFARFDPQQINEPLAVTPAAGGVYMSDANRFRTDTAGEERRARDESSHREAARLAAKRDSNLAREEKRWVDMGAAAQAEEARIADKRAVGLASKKNAPSLPFNPITLEYSGGYAGGMLAHQDNLVKYRSALRTQNLYSRGNGDFNPVTGQPRLNLAPPPKPQTPQR